MRFPPSFLEEIRARVPVSAVVGRRVKLKKQGREWRGLSPFNAEKTPSFYVNDQKMAWFDFSSGKNGNVFDFVMLTEGLTFPEAVERLAGEAGLSLPKPSPEAERREEARRTLSDVLELAAKFFEASLQGRAGAKARGYLADREIGPEAQASFRLGYAPGERFALRDHLAAKGVSKEDMIGAGLLVHGEDIAVPYDRFRDRVMFPIEDLRGRVIAFGGRALDADAPAKYLNSPETALFQKGAIVYNAHRARKAAHDAGRVIVVEGYVDVVTLAQAGIGEAVAPLGTALTEAQLDLVWRTASEPILCFDGDKAGLRAAQRAVETALPKIGPDRSVRFAFLPAGLDPDDLVRRRGREAMEDVLGAARPLVDVLWDRETAAGDLSTPERRAGFEARLRTLVATIADADVRRLYDEEIRRRLRGAPPPAVQPRAGAFPRTQGFERTRGFRAGAVPPAPRVAGASRLGRASRGGEGRSALPEREALLVAVMANHPALAAKHVEAFASLDLDDRELDGLRAAVLDALAAGAAPDAPAVAQAVEARGLGGVHRAVNAIARRSGLWYVDALSAREDAETSWLQLVALHRRSRTLHRELKAAEAAFGLDPSEANDARLRAIRREVFEAEGAAALIEGYGASSGRAPRAG
jgi:DNA primase